MCIFEIKWTIINIIIISKINNFLSFKVDKMNKYYKLV
jgi:hypothetical protein